MVDENKSDVSSGPVAGEHEADAPYVAPVEPKLWQVKFASGQGQQIHAPSADAVREMMVTHYGLDHEIESILPVVVKVD